MEKWAAAIITISFINIISIGIYAGTAEEFVLEVSRLLNTSAYVQMLINLFLRILSGLVFN